MRPIFAIGMLGGALAIGSAQAQSSSDQQPAAPKRTEPHSKRGDWLFEGGPEPKDPAAARAPLHQNQAPAASEAAPAAPPAPPAAPVIPTVQAAPPGPPQKNLTGEEFSQIHAGSTMKEVLATLGPPSSKVAIPDDDGHLRETLQYWVKGAPMATIRLDNGRVASIETKRK
jgi:hypothetical protein